MRAGQSVLTLPTRRSSLATSPASDPKSCGSDVSASVELGSSEDCFKMSHERDVRR